MLIASFTAIAWYNVIEINVMIWSRFKRHKGLYFWSLCISSWGIALHALAFLAKFFQVWHNDTVSVAVIVVGWYGMVSGQILFLVSPLKAYQYEVIVTTKAPTTTAFFLFLGEIYMLTYNHLGNRSISGVVLEAPSRHAKQQKNQMGFVHDHRRLLPLSCFHYCAHIWCKHKYKKNIRKITETMDIGKFGSFRNLYRSILCYGEDSSHCIRDARNHYISALYILHLEDNPARSSLSETSLQKGYAAATDCQYLHNNHGLVSFGNRIRQSL